MSTHSFFNMLCNSVGFISFYLLLISSDDKLFLFVVKWRKRFIGFAFYLSVTVSNVAFIFVLKCLVHPIFKY